MPTLTYHSPHTVSENNLPVILLPLRPSFTGHQTFALRTGWLKKGVDALRDAGPDVFSRDDALVTLGVGKNMVQSIRHWLTTTRMAADRREARGREMEATRIGKALFGSKESEGWDPFLEDDGTLWLLHWQLAGPGSSAFSWVWTFNEIRSSEFAKATLIEAVENSAVVRVPKPPGRETVTRDLECLLHTYVPPEGDAASLDTIDCPLNTLGLIRQSAGHQYRFGIGPKSTLPSPIFFFAMLQFWQWRGTGRTLSIQDIAYGEGSPGRVFKLDEDSILYYLDDLAEMSHDAFRYDDVALSPQVIQNWTGISLEEASFDLLQGYYDNV